MAQKHTKRCSTLVFIERMQIKTTVRGFPGDLLVKNPPANAGDTGANPDLGRPHVPWSNQAPGQQLLSHNY